MSLLEVRQIGKREGEKTVLADINFVQQQFQHIAIAGATGSGKTTLLRIIGGLIQPSTGEALLEGNRIIGPEEQLIPGHPSIAYLSQHFELRNHYHVKELIDMRNHLTDEEAKTICLLCRVDHLLDRWSHQLSGGERQRIALACLLVASPKLLLLDEPFSNLDTIHKNILKTVINDVSEHLGMTCMLVDHDPLDVLPWADEIIVLREGKMIQKGNPQKIYREPANEYVAALFGKYNQLTTALAKSFSQYSDITLERINAFLRPENFKVSVDPGTGLKAQVVRATFMGNYFELIVDAADSRLTLHSPVFVEKDASVYISLQ